MILFGLLRVNWAAGKAVGQVAIDDPVAARPLGNRELLLPLIQELLGLETRMG